MFMNTRGLLEKKLARLEIITSITITKSLLWDVTPWSLVGIHRYSEKRLPFRKNQHSLLKRKIILPVNGNNITEDNTPNEILIINKVKLCWLKIIQDFSPDKLEYEHSVPCPVSMHWISSFQKNFSFRFYFSVLSSHALPFKSTFFTFQYVLHGLFPGHRFVCCAVGSQRTNLSKFKWQLNYVTPLLQQNKVAYCVRQEQHSTMLLTYLCKSIDICIYMYVFMYVCMYVCMYVYMHVYMHVFMYVCVCMYVYIYSIYVCMYVLCLYICMYVRVCMYVCIMYVRTYECMYVCTNACIYMCMYVWMCVCVCTYECTQDMYCTTVLVYFRRTNSWLNTSFELVKVSTVKSRG